MTEVLHSPSHFASSPTATTARRGRRRGSAASTSLSSSSSSSSSSCADEEDGEGGFAVTGCGAEEGDKRSRDQQLSLLALLVTLFRKSLVACKSDRRELCSSMEIGWPTDVRHVAHVTFDRFNGFLGLPDEFEPEVPRRPPSASTTVFGVSTESMQLSYDSRGNSVPTILLLMQGHLYAQGGLRAEGIFRINAENSQEEFVRDQVNRGVIPEGIDVHCLAGLIKAWFRELPTGILDSLEPEQVIQCETEEECAALVRLLPPTEGALLDWAINLMADVVQHEDLNKMNARNIAMVFAPNMTQMADPLTALMYAVQVMNFLKTLILKTLKDRKDSVIDPSPARHLEPSDENGHQSPSQTCAKEAAKDNEETEQVLTAEKPNLGSSLESNQENNLNHEEVDNLTSFVQKLNSYGDSSAPVDTSNNNKEAQKISCVTLGVQENAGKTRTGQSSSSNFRKGAKKISSQQQEIQVAGHVRKSKGISKLSRMESRMELIEAWR